MRITRREVLGFSNIRQNAKRVVLNDIVDRRREPRRLH